MTRNLIYLQAKETQRIYSQTYGEKGGKGQSRRIETQVLIHAEIFP